MNRKNDMFSIFENVGDDIAERISNSFQSMSREEKERVFAMSERKLNDMKKTKKRVDEVNVGVKSRTVENNVGKVEISDNPRSRRIAVTVTAVAAAFALIVGVALAAKNVGDIDVDSDISSVSLDKDLYAQVKTTSDNADCENSNTVTSRESSADSEKVSGEENSKKEEKSSREKSSSSEVTSSKSESVVLESTVSNEVQSDINSQSADVNEQKPDTISNESISIAAEETDTDIRPSENAAGVYSSKSGIITLYADGTGTISFQDTVSIKWNDQVLIGEDFTYPYTISGDTITIDVDGMERSFTKGGEMPQSDINPIMNFVGTYIGTYPVDRATMLVEALGDNSAKITISWAGSAWNKAVWTMSGECVLTEDSLLVSYQDSTCRNVEYNSDGTVESDTTEYTDGTGTLTFKGNTVEWDDDSENAYGTMVFEYSSASY